MKTLLLIALIALTGCQAPDRFKSEADLIIGEWVYTYPNGCEEITILNSDGTWFAESYQETSQGVYYVEEHKSGRHRLVYRTNGNNMQPDCEGDSESGVNTIDSYYVYFDFITNDQIDFLPEDAPTITMYRR